MSSWDPKIEEKLKRLSEVELALQDPNIVKDLDNFRKLGKELRELQRVQEVHADLEKNNTALIEANQIIADPDGDSELKELAALEIPSLEKEQSLLQAAMEDLLVKKDPLLDKNAVIEVRAGTGGAEASLFASDIVRMFTKFASGQGFKTEILSQALTESGGIREMILSVTGDGVYGRFKFESGVHRVQRVPATEASGRIHTSAVTVAVMPEAEDVEIAIKNEDLRIDVFRSGGPGGQSVNTTDSAVRITHVPTGLVVKCQDEKSQLKNKAKAMKILRARLFDQIQRNHDQAMAQKRKAQVGTGDRSEKIRTYNFPDRRVTDHRIGLTLHKLEAILEGDLGEVVDALHAKERELESSE